MTFLDLMANAAASLAPVDDSNSSSTNATKSISNEHITQDVDNERPPLLREDSINSTSSSGVSSAGSVTSEMEATDADDTASNNKNSGGKRSSSNIKPYLPFPVVLMQLLQDKTHSDVISFLPDGRSFVITDRKTFASTVMPKVFHLKRLDTFLKKLKRWGFRGLSEVSADPVNDSRDSLAFYHTEDKFRAGNIALCRRIRRRQAHELENCRSDETATLLSQKRRMLLQGLLFGSSPASPLMQEALQVASLPRRASGGFLTSAPLNAPVLFSEAEINAATSNIVGAAVDVLMRDQAPSASYIRDQGRQQQQQQQQQQANLAIGRRMSLDSTLHSTSAVSREQLRLSGLSVGTAAVPSVPAVNDGPSGAILSLLMRQM